MPKIIEWNPIFFQKLFNPEQGYGETATTSRIKQFLEEYGVPFCNFGHMTGGYAWICLLYTSFVSE